MASYLFGKLLRDSLPPLASTASTTEISSLFAADRVTWRGGGTSTSLARIDRCIKSLLWIGTGFIKNDTG